MARMLRQIAKRLSVRSGPASVTNAPSSGSGGGGGATINRDPKATQVKRVGYQLTGGSGGGRENFEAPEADFQTIEDAIKRDSYLTQATAKYVELIFKSGWAYEAKNPQALEYLKLRFEMMQIATGIPTEELWQGIAQDIVKFQNSFILKARAKGGQGLPPGISAAAIPPSKEPVAGYFRVPPQSMEISRDQNGTITKYKQEIQGGGDPLEFKPEDVIHIKANVPVGKAFGEPWLAPVIEDLRLLRKVEENAALLLYRHIFPLLKYRVGLDKPGSQATDEELEELRAIINDMPTDGALVLPERHDVEAVQINAIDGKPYLEYFENRVFSGLGMSQVDFGRGDTANRNTADAMTGNKADRVKGWQQVIQSQINNYIIDELLVEGGFDPLANPDNHTEFVFNEIELERRIAKETHQVFLFNNNGITFEELRQGIGKEPVVDESRLHFNMIGAVVNGPETSGEADNKNQPENQNGKRSGPKKATERVKGIHEQYGGFKSNTVHGRPAQTVKEGEEDKRILHHLLSRDVSAISGGLEKTLHHAENEVIKAFDSVMERNAHPQRDFKSLHQPIVFQSEEMAASLNYKLNEYFLEGLAEAQAQTGRSNLAKINKTQAERTMTDFAKDSFESLQGQLLALIENRMTTVENKTEGYTAIRTIFESMRYKLRSNSKTILAKSYNYGYALAMMHYEESVSILDHGECQKCRVKNEAGINVKGLSSMDEIAIFYRIPPWHPNCECELIFKGGE